jgi:hypothetical protein
VAQNLLKYQAVGCPKNLQEIAISADTEYHVFWIPDEKIPFKRRVQSAAKRHSSVPLWCTCTTQPAVVSGRIRLPTARLVSSLRTVHVTQRGITSQHSKITAVSCCYWVLHHRFRCTENRNSVNNITISNLSDFKQRKVKSTSSIHVTNLLTYSYVAYCFAPFNVYFNIIN